MTAPTAPDAEAIAGTVLDGAASGVVRNYADALLGAAGNESGAVLDELDAIVADVVRGQPRFAELMASPKLGASDRDRVLVALFGGKVAPTVVNFLRVLNRHGRISLLAAIAAAARAEWDRKQGRRPVTVRSAVSLDDGQKKALESKLSNLIGATPVLTLEVDPTLIAGLVVQVGDDVYDASVRTQLSRLRDRLIERKSHAQV
jgi:F-type H+-transporting ATPase subunit delta